MFGRVSTKDLNIWIAGLKRSQMTVHTRSLNLLKKNLRGKVFDLIAKSDLPLEDKAFSSRELLRSKFNKYWRKLIRWIVSGDETRANISLHTFKYLYVDASMRVDVAVKLLTYLKRDVSLEISNEICNLLRDYAEDVTLNRKIWSEFQRMNLCSSCAHMEPVLALKSVIETNDPAKPVDYSLIRDKLESDYPDIPFSEKPGPQEWLLANIVYFRPGNLNAVARFVQNSNRQVLSELEPLLRANSSLSSVSKMLRSIISNDYFKEKNAIAIHLLKEGLQLNYRFEEREKLIEFALNLGCGPKVDQIEQAIDLRDGFHITLEMLIQILTRAHVQTIFEARNVEKLLRLVLNNDEKIAVFKGSPFEHLEGAGNHFIVFLTSWNYGLNDVFTKRRHRKFALGFIKFLLNSEEMGPIPLPVESFLEVTCQTDVGLNLLLEIAASRPEYNDRIISLIMKHCVDYVHRVNLAQDLLHIPGILQQKEISEFISKLARSSAGRPWWPKRKLKKALKHYRRQSSDVNEKILIDELLAERFLNY